MAKVMTELEQLKAKCLKKDGSPRKDAKSHDLVRLKQLQDGEPLTEAELKEAKRREAQRHEQEVKAYKEKHQSKQPAQPAPKTAASEYDQPADHPRIQKIKQALMPFTQLEVHESRPDDFILINRGVAITAGDVRLARKAMTF